MESSLVSIHQRHLRFLVPEIYKNTTQKNHEIMWPYFTCNNIAYNVRKGPILTLDSTHSTYYGTNSVYFWGSLIWNNVPRDVKSSKSVSELRTLEILNADVQYVVRLIYTLNFCCEITKSIMMKITTFHPVIKSILNDIRFFHVLLISWSLQL